MVDKEELKSLLRDIRSETDLSKAKRDTKQPLKNGTKEIGFGE